MAQPPHIKKFPAGSNVRATFKTNRGTFVAELFAEQCPVTVGSFAGLATGETEWRKPGGSERSNEPFYDGTTFHRIIPNFMIQGGCPLGNGTGSPGFKFDDEIHPELTHDQPGRLSMANSGPNTNGSQFFVTEVETPWLDGKHAVFGQVIEGMDVVLKIAKTETGPMDRPIDPVIIESLTIATE